jgi:AcrR family transcriptional regulator
MMPRIVDKEKKTRDIARAALRVFGRLGYHQTRMGDIAAEAGIGKGTVYEYFKNKQEILQFELDQYFSTFKEGFAQTVRGTPSAGERILTLIDFAFNHVAEWEEHCAAFVDYFSVARKREDPGLSLAQIYEEMGVVLRFIIEEGQAAGQIRKELDPVATAEFLISMFDGIVLHGVFAERACGTESLKSTAVMLISAGLLVRQSATMSDGTL